jgi:hypothetical protein
VQSDVRGIERVRLPVLRILVGKVEFGRHDANDREWRSLHGNASSDDVARTAELSLPQAVADDRRGWGAIA